MLDLNVAGAASVGTLALTSGDGASFGGDLRVTFVLGFVPTVGQEFTIVTYPSETGTFSVHLPAGVSGSVDYGATTAVLTITGVGSATLQSIAVTPANPSIAAGLTQQFTATGTYSDNSTADLTGSVSWASATPGTATIGATTGLATGVAVGTASISATVGSVTGSTVLTVTSATLQSIAVTPANPSIAAGASQQFAATGTYSDGSHLDLSAAVTWASGTTATATIGATSGLATGVAAGTSSISATLGNVSGSTVLTVTAATLQSIAVTPANPSIAAGSTQQFVATGTYSDNSTAIITGSVTWASATTTVATIGATSAWPLAWLSAPPASAQRWDSSAARPC